MRYPEWGMVKTRLSSILDEDCIVTLYRCFVEDVLDTIHNSGCRIHLVFSPQHRQPDMVGEFGSSYTYVAHRGRDMGERMRNAFEHCFTETPVTAAVLIGTDIPDIPAAVIEEAFVSLKNHDAVIGPAHDGGYYLIGFNETTQYTAVFRDIEWGSHTVFDETMGILRDRGCRVHILPSWRDIDRSGDLRFLVKENKNAAFRHSKTLRYLTKIGFIDTT